MQFIKPIQNFILELYEFAPGTETNQEILFPLPCEIRI